MENPNTNIEMYGKFTWTINDFSTVMPDLSSDPFSFDGHKWRIIMDYVSNSLSIYLDSAVDNMPHGWEKTVNYNLILINQLQAKRNIINECNATFHSNSRPCGFEAIDLNKLWDSSCGFIVDDTCIVEVHIKVEKEVDESVRNVDNKLVERIQNLPPQEMISTEMVDFRGIGK
ncbi:protein RESTRICTED TEV MOVEMENT 3-like, partial [Vigna radiata var. radiata]|uniref:Protein RESTRICTED TEV MOVEMENT 3-like n=1 Tax=Vigna radiata var. radiata TaxID=3916 RepID=A0A1S3TEU3_VIGRR